MGIDYIQRQLKNAGLPIDPQEASTGCSCRCCSRIALDALKQQSGELRLKLPLANRVQVCASLSQKDQGSLACVSRNSLKMIQEGDEGLFHQLLRKLSGFEDHQALLNQYLEEEKARAVPVLRPHDRAIQRYRSSCDRALMVLARTIGLSTQRPEEARDWLHNPENEDKIKRITRISLDSEEVEVLPTELRLFNQVRALYLYTGSLRYLHLENLPHLMSLRGQAGTLELVVMRDLKQLKEVKLFCGPVEESQVRGQIDMEVQFAPIGGGFLLHGRKPLTPEEEVSMGWMAGLGLVGDIIE